MSLSENAYKNERHIQHVIIIRLIVKSYKSNSVCQACLGHAGCRNILWSFYRTQLDSGLFFFSSGSVPFFAGKLIQTNAAKRTCLLFYACSLLRISDLFSKTQLNRVSEPCWSSACQEPLKLPNCLAPLSVSHAISQKANNLSLSHRLHVQGKSRAASYQRQYWHAENIQRSISF